MKAVILRALPLLLIMALAMGGCAQAAPADTAAPWPTHAPGATPYVRTASAQPAPAPEEGETYESFGALWDDIYERFGNFHARKEELEMFRELPQEEPYAFVPHSPLYVLDEGESMRMARLFDALEGCEARVIAMHQIVDGNEDWGFMTVVTMTPARLFELSEQLEEPFYFEQFYPQVKERFDIAYWPDGLYADAEAMLHEGYSNLGCFWFEPDFLEQFRAMPAAEAAEFVLAEHTPSGWNTSGQNILWQLQGRTDCPIVLRWRQDSWESLAVITASPDQLTALSDQLPGRYLVQPLTEELRERFDRVLDPKEDP